jgi:hypothetical protein
MYVDYAASLDSLISSINIELQNLNFPSLDLSEEPLSSEKALNILSSLISSIHSKRYFENSEIPKFTADIANKEISIVCYFL